jgi:hypothetical protein
VVLALGAVGLVVLGVTRLRHEDSVLVLGDSMAYLAAGPLEARGHDHHYDVTVSAEAGIPLSARLDALKQIAASGVDRLVVELGTNDVLQGASPPTIDALIDQATILVGGVSCVVFVNVGILADGDPAAHFNEHLTADVALHPNQHVYDWASDYRAHPERTADGIHVQEQYRNDYATGVIGAVSQACD